MREREAALAEAQQRHRSQAEAQAARLADVELRERALQAREQELRRREAAAEEEVAAARAEVRQAREAAAEAGARRRRVEELAVEQEEAAGRLSEERAVLDAARTALALEVERERAAVRAEVSRHADRLALLEELPGREELVRQAEVALAAREAAVATVEARAKAVAKDEDRLLAQVGSVGHRRGGAACCYGRMRGLGNVTDSVKLAPYFPQKSEHRRLAAQVAEMRADAERLEERLQALAEEKRALEGAIARNASAAQVGSADEALLCADACQSRHGWRTGLAAGPTQHVASRRRAPCIALRASAEGGRPRQRGSAGGRCCQGRHGGAGGGDCSGGGEWAAELKLEQRVATFLLLRSGLLAVWKSVARALACRRRICRPGSGCCRRRLCGWRRTRGGCRRRGRRCGGAGRA